MTFIRGGGGTPVSTVPTAANWTLNTETITAEKLLTDSDPTIQVLTMATDQSVILPPFTTDTPFFVLTNSPNSAGNLLVRDQARVIMRTIAPGQSSQLLSNGTNGFSLAPVAYQELLSTPALLTSRAAYRFFHKVSNIFIGTPAYLWANYETTSPSIAILDPRTDQVIAEAGTINEVIIAGVPGGNGITFSIWINGVLDTTLPPVTSNPESFSVSIAVAAGDKLAIRYDGVGASPASPVVTVFVDTADRASVSWGGTVTVPMFLPTNSGYAFGGGTTASDSYLFGHMFDNACSALALSYNTVSGVNADTIDIYKNGVFSETVTMTGASGVGTGLTTTFAQGDWVSIRAGQATGRANFTLVVDRVGSGIGDKSAALPYGGNFAANGSEIPAGGRYNSASFAHGHVAPTAGWIERISVCVANDNLPTANARFEIRLNGGATAATSGIIVNGGGLEQTLEFDSQVLVAAGDLIQLKGITVQPIYPGQMNAVIHFQKYSP